MHKQWGWGAIVVLWIGASWGWAQEVELAAPAAVAEGAASDTDVLARGPVHEAFAEMISPDPEPGLIVPKAPPEPIDELPPEWKPEGDDVEWIPGYWFWDEERADFMWVSGVWRRVPPGRRWVPGYWQAVAGGHQWTPGFWGAVEESVVTYLDAPPESLDTGPSSPAPTEDMFWMPGAWEFHTTAYRWRPGCWHPFRADWTWVSARFIWTPRGYIYIPGYWDYTLTRRGFLFAPVYFSNTVYLRPGFAYRPTFWIGADAMLLHLFVSPACQHLYFGDYYAMQYRQRHFIPCVDYHERHRGFSSLYVYYENHYRHHNIDYCQRVHQWHDTYARRADLRPPHTYNIQLDNHRHGANDLLTDVVRPFHVAGGSDQDLVGGQRLVAISGHDHDLMRSESKRIRSLASERSHFELASATAHDVSTKISKGKRDLATFKLPDAPQEIVRSRSFKKAPPTLTFSPDTLPKRKLMHEAPKSLGAAGAVEGTNHFDSQVTDALRKRAPRLPLASDMQVDSSNVSGNVSGESKGRSMRRLNLNPEGLGAAAGTEGSSSNSSGAVAGGPSKGRSVRRLNLNPEGLGAAAGTEGSSSTSSGDAAGGPSKGRSVRRLNLNPEGLGAAAGTEGSSSNSGGDAAGGLSKGRSMRRGLSTGLDSVGAENGQSTGAESTATGALLPFSSARTRVKSQLPPAARKGLPDSATHLNGVDLGGGSQGLQGSAMRIRSGAEGALRKGPAGDLGSAAQSGGGAGSTEGISHGPARFRSGGKGKGRGGE